MNHKRAIIAAVLVALAVADVHFMIWASTWPHWRGDPWLWVGMIDACLLVITAWLCVPKDWLS